jgi:hypothetical protein
MLTTMFSPRVGLLLGMPILVMTEVDARAQAPASLRDVSIYPNPAHIRTTVTVPVVPGTTRATVTLSDAQGTVLFEQPLSLTEEGGRAEVPLLGRPPGSYFVQVRAGEQRVARILTVE